MQNHEVLTPRETHRKIAAMARPSSLVTALLLLAAVGDILFFLWMCYNAVESGFATSGPVELVSLVGLMCLLLLNAVLLLIVARNRSKEK
jgi:hypothetical protein